MKANDPKKLLSTIFSGLEGSGTDTQVCYHFILKVGPPRLEGEGSIYRGSAVLRSGSLFLHDGGSHIVEGASILEGEGNY